MKFSSFSPVPDSQESTWQELPIYFLLTCSAVGCLNHKVWVDVDTSLPYIPYTWYLHFEKGACTYTTWI